MRGTPGFVPERLRQALNGLELSANALAAQVGVKRQAISELERGNSTPRPEVFERLAELLKQPREFFLKPVPEKKLSNPVFYRSMASATKSARSRAEKSPARATTRGRAAPAPR